MFHSPYPAHPLISRGLGEVNYALCIELRVVRVPLLVEHISVERLVCALRSESGLVGSHLRCIFQTLARCRCHAFELSTLCQLALRGHRAALTVAHCELGTAAVSETHCAVLTDLATHILYRILKTYFCHTLVGFSE